MSIMEYNGGAVIAMKGKDCVLLATDLRYGAQQMTISANFPKTYQITDRVFVGLVGLATDQQTVFEILRFKSNMYKLREGRTIGAKTLACLTSSTLYERRFGPYYVEPIVCGLDGPDNKPFIAAYDLIGAGVFADDFVVGGTCSESLYGMCEALWKPDLEADDLFEVISQALLSAVNRDALSGWGAQVTIIQAGKVTVKTLKARQD